MKKNPSEKIPLLTYFTSEKLTFAVERASSMWLNYFREKSTFIFNIRDLRNGPVRLNGLKDLRNDPIGLHINDLRDL